MSLNTVTLRTHDELASFFSEATGMIPGYRQLSRGAPRIDYVTADLGGVSLLWSRNTAHALWRDEMIADGGLQIGCLIDAGGEVVVRGTDVDRDHALVWMAGQEMEYLHKDGIVSFEIGVDSEIVDAHGWDPRGEPLQRIPDGRLAVLVEVARAATDAAAQTPPSETDARVLAEHRARVLAALGRVLAVWMAPPEGDATLAGVAARHYAVFAEAERAFDRRRGARLGVDALADAVGVSRRTLYTAFEKSIGVGPRRFFEVKRLHQLHDRLRAATTENATVTRLATELDFFDLGRMAGAYRELFGEYPSETLLRRR